MEALGALLRHPSATDVSGHQRGRRRRLLALMVATAVVLAGCSGGAGDDKASDRDGSSPSSTAAQTGPAACDLLTAKEVEAVVARPVGAPTKEADRCTWAAVDGPGFVTVAVRRDDNAKALLDAGRATDGGEPVEGIGDDAYVALPAQELGIVAFVRGPMQVSILARSTARDRNALLQLAGAVAGRV